MNVVVRALKMRNDSISNCYNVVENYETFFSLFLTWGKPVGDPVYEDRGRVIFRLLLGTSATLTELLRGPPGSLRNLLAGSPISSGKK